MTLMMLSPGPHRSEGRDGRVLRTSRRISMEQADVALAILDRSGLTPETSTFIEADEHGWSVHAADGGVVVAWEGDDGQWEVVDAIAGQIERVLP